MRTLVLLVLTIVAVTGSRRNKAEEFLLMEIMDNVDQILQQSSASNLSQFVKDVFPAAGCSEKHLCQAAMVMTNTHLNHCMLHRRLFAYANYSGVKCAFWSATVSGHFTANYPRLNPALEQLWSFLHMNT
ncbi:hypothetical protein Q8A67_013963 [Cirrhinus molitorella]|uniref:Uncharacterized protein n=1 Tax=Cirrhinus molitorella TaxID=172907 RepID=A0AA88PSX3_9TELE|nr:hypothetical protein Q8A67_013963 [Cirrhinus molitorella]